MTIIKFPSPLKGDQLALIEHEIRTTGKWADVTGLDKFSHYFVAKNASVNTAVSLCFQVVTTFEKLREPISGRKCLVCQMYQTNKEAQSERNDKLLDSQTSE